MRFDVRIEIEAAPEQIWETLRDVAHWPDWSPTMDSVRPLGTEPFGLGSAAEVRQPKLAKAIWRVTAFEPGRRFQWAATMPGVTTTADHRIEPLPDGGCRVLLDIEYTGVLARPLWLLYGKLTRRYLSLEAASLKRRCEAGSIDQVNPEPRG